MAKKADKQLIVGGRRHASCWIPSFSPKSSRLQKRPLTAEWGQICKIKLHKFLPRLAHEIRSGNTFTPQRSKPKSIKYSWQRSSTPSHCDTLEFVLPSAPSSETGCNTLNQSHQLCSYFAEKVRQRYSCGHSRAKQPSQGKTERYKIRACPFSPRNAVNAVLIKRLTQYLSNGQQTKAVRAGQRPDGKP